MDKLQIRLPWWHRALRPWFEFLAAHKAARDLRRFHRVGYFLEVCSTTKRVIGVIEASQNGCGARKLKRLQGYGDQYAIPRAWVAGDDSTAAYLHPTPFKQDHIQASTP